MKRKINKKSCWTCKNCILNPGSFGNFWEPPEPEHIEDCKVELSQETLDKMEEIGWDEEKCPNICNSYDPDMVENCGNHKCQKPINVPYYKHPFFAYCYEEIPVCSIECKQKVEKEFKKEITGRY